MGDRCYMNITVREEDVKKLEDKLGSGETLEHVSPYAAISFDEVNYGGQTDRNELASDGLVFYGWHGAGVEYGPYEFAAYGGIMLDVPVMHDGGDYVVRFNPNTGRVVSGEIKQIKEFLKLKKKANAYIKRKVK